MREETFAPKINKASNSRQRVKMTAMEHGHMLSQRSKAKEELREAIREENLAKELKECTF